jgi:transposase
MSDKSPLVVTAEQRVALERLARSSDREEADRARGILLSASGWTSPQIGEALRVREDTVRNWRSAFMRKGVEAIIRHVAPGRAPVKAQAALKIAGEVLTTPVENRTNWTLPRLAEEIERRSGHRISRSRLSVVLRKKGAMPASGPATR